MTPRHLLRFTHLSALVLRADSKMITFRYRAGARAVDFRSIKHLSGGGPKFEIKHKSRRLQKSKLVNWGAKHVDWGAASPDLGPVLLELNKPVIGFGIHGQ